jgi:hypothetical protein
MFTQPRYGLRVLAAGSSRGSAAGHSGGCPYPRVTPAATVRGPDHHRTTGQSHSHSNRAYSAPQERTGWTTHPT